MCMYPALPPTDCAKLKDVDELSIPANAVAVAGSVPKYARTSESALSPVIVKFAEATTVVDALVPLRIVGTAPPPETFNVTAPPELLYIDALVVEAAPYPVNIIPDSVYVPGVVIVIACPVPALTNSESSIVDGLAVVNAVVDGEPVIRLCVISAPPCVMVWHLRNVVSITVVFAKNVNAPISVNVQPSNKTVASLVTMKLPRDTVLNDDIEISVQDTLLEAFLTSNKLKPLVTNSVF